MIKFKHSKYKNTGIIFELLSRQVTSDILADNKNTSLNIIRKYFKENTELHKDLLCYQALIDYKGAKESTASKLIDIIFEQRSQIDLKKLNREKYNLIGEIKNNYMVDTFFDARLPQYRLYASIFKLFEYRSADNPIGHVDCYDTIVEHLTGKQSPKNIVSETTNILDNQPKEIQKLVFKMIIEKFNSKYQNLNNKQRTLISRFINENTNLNPFKNFVYSEINSIKDQLSTYSTKINDKSLKIKLDEVVNLTSEIVSSKRVKDEHISSMLKYYELIDFLGSVNE